MDSPDAVAARDAAEALIALGWPVKPYRDDRSFWQIGDAILTGDELVSFAGWAPNPLHDEPSRSPTSDAQRRQKPPRELVEALESIRAIIDVAAGPATGTQVEPAVRLIRGILDDALPPRSLGLLAKR